MQARFDFVAAEVARKPAEVALWSNHVVFLEVEVLLHAALGAPFLAVEAVFDTALLSTVAAVVRDANPVDLRFLYLQIFLDSAPFLHYSASVALWKGHARLGDIVRPAILGPHWVVLRLAVRNFEVLIVLLNRIVEEEIG